MDMKIPFGEGDFEDYFMTTMCEFCDIYDDDESVIDTLYKVISDLIEERATMQDKITELTQKNEELEKKLKNGKIIFKKVKASEEDD